MRAAMITPALDAAYMKAVRKGDIFSARRILHKAAEKLGLRFAFHGTNRAFFHFEPPSKVGRRHRDDEVGDVFWFTTSYNVACNYAKSPWTQNKQHESRPVQVPKSFPEDGAKSTITSVCMEHAPLTPRVIESFLCLTNPLIEHYDGAPADYLPDDILKARANGNDGLIAFDVDDGGTHDHYAVFASTQIIDASTIVRGFTGDVLSVSERLFRMAPTIAKDDRRLTRT